MLGPEWEFRIDEGDHWMHGCVFRGKVSEWQNEKRDCITCELWYRFVGAHVRWMISRVASGTKIGKTWNYCILAVLARTGSTMEWRIRFQHSNWNDLKTP